MAIPTIDPTIYITPSDELVTFLRSTSLIDPPTSVAKILDGGTATLTATDLKWLRDSGQCGQLGELLMKSSLALPSPVFPERSPQLEERVKRLRAEQEEKEYRRMTANVRKGLDKSQQAG